jgi:hypothetical protein
MSTILEKERAARTIAFSRQLVEQHLRNKLEAAIVRWNPAMSLCKGGLVEMLMAMDGDRWRTVMQISDPVLRKASQHDIDLIVGRYEPGQEAQRSLWRRRCKAYGISTKPACVTKASDYQKRRYANGRGSGKRLAMMYDMRNLIDDYLQDSAASLVRARDVLMEIRKIVDRAILC